MKRSRQSHRLPAGLYMVSRPVDSPVTWISLSSRRHCVRIYTCTCYHSIRLLRAASPLQSRRADRVSTRDGRTREIALMPTHSHLLNVPQTYFLRRLQTLRSFLSFKWRFTSSSPLHPSPPPFSPLPSPDWFNASGRRLDIADVTNLCEPMEGEPDRNLMTTRGCGRSSPTIKSDVGTAQS